MRVKCFPRQMMYIHIDKHEFKVPFVCGAKDLGEALSRINGGRVHDPYQRRAGNR